MLDKQKAEIKFFQDKNGSYWKFKFSSLESIHNKLKEECDIKNDRIPYYDFLSQFYVTCWKEKSILLSELDYWDFDHQLCFANNEDAFEWWQSHYGKKEGE